MNPPELTPTVIIGAIAAAIIGMFAGAILTTAWQSWRRSKDAFDEWERRGRRFDGPAWKNLLGSLRPKDARETPDPKRVGAILRIHPRGQITIDEVDGPGVYCTAEVWMACNCPVCEHDGHWMQVAGGAGRTEIEETARRRAGRTGLPMITIDETAKD